VQVIGVPAIIGTIANTRYAWSTLGGWWRKLNNLELVLACCATLGSSSACT
jgi:hypothetical protein